MILNVYSIFDIKSKAFDIPLFITHTGQATRSFGDLVNDTRSAVNKHPEDYKLYHIGEWEDSAGKMTAYDVPIFLVNATDYVKKES